MTLQSNAGQLALIAQEIGAEVMRGPVRYGGRRERTFLVSLLRGAQAFARPRSSAGTGRAWPAAPSGRPWRPGGRIVRSC